MQFFFLLKLYISELFHKLLSKLKVETGIFYSKKLTSLTTDVLFSFHLMWNSCTDFTCFPFAF